jgi:hypothetical protein
MRQIFFALAVLSTFASAQNVLALSPAPLDAAPVVAAAPPSEAPPMGSLAMLLAGLVGLTAAGRRIEGRTAL